MRIIELAVVAMPQISEDTSILNQGQNWDQFMLDRAIEVLRERGYGRFRLSPTRDPWWEDGNHRKCMYRFDEDPDCMLSVVLDFDHNSIAIFGSIPG